MAPYWQTMVLNYMKDKLRHKLLNHISTSPIQSSISVKIDSCGNKYRESKCKWSPMNRLQLWTWNLRENVGCKFLRGAQTALDLQYTPKDIEKKELENIANIYINTIARVKARLNKNFKGLTSWKQSGE